MNVQEALVTSLEHLAAHKLRSLLTMLGIVFGVGAVIAMLSIGAGAERQSLETISRLGLRNVVIRAKELEQTELQEVRAKSVGLSLRDVEAIEQTVPGVALVAPKVEIDARTVLAAHGTAEPGVYGVSDRHAALAGLELANGRFLDARDLRDHSQVAVIGEAVRKALFGWRPALGEHLKVNDVWLEVVGVLDDAGGEVDTFQGVQLGSTSNAIYIPVTTAQRKFEREPLAAPLSEVIVQLERAGGVGASGRIIAGLLERLHAGVEDYELVVPEALLAESRRTQRMFNIVMGCIAGISLVVGGIGIMNIMLATVLERTREIGVRRAVGARRRDILVQFIVESFALSALGGVVGVVAGIAIAKVVAASAGWPTLVTVWSVALATGVAMAVGLTSGFYPALRAAQLDPIDALRYE